MMTNEEILEIFKKSGALLQGHFLLTSGKHSDQYIQCAQVLKYPTYTEQLARELMSKLRGEYDFVIGPAVGGIIVAYEVARALNVPALFTEREAGKMTLRRGFEIKPDTKALVVEDVITTGGSVKEVIEVVKQYGASVEDIAVLVDRSGGKAQFEAELVSLLQPTIKTYEANDCPLCETDIPPVKPGSRSI